jgi:aspartyl-tRNA(Asn)/glutamyl-tRNA(Gln) amidotransferase subunit B
VGEYKIRIGLEIHVELATKTKIFCGCAAAFGAPPNSLCCPTCLGLPGSLPVLNRAAVEFGVRAALALNCTVNLYSEFARKNYFYPDLPKAFQITQHDKPLAVNGKVQYYLEDQPVETVITRLHLEEEAGKSIHSGDSIVGSEYTSVDYNRAGIPLIEIVTAPDITSPAQAKAFLEQLRLILQYAQVSDCKMENGSLRCDANISLHGESGQNGEKVEIKNLNSFRALERALAYEAKRQAKILEQGGVILPETRTWDERAQKTVRMRLKAGAPDYRYFPEPDLPPLELDEAWVEEIRAALPELPLAREERYRSALGLTAYDAGVLVRAPHLAQVFEETVALGHEPQLVANWVTGEYARFARQGSTVSGKLLGELLELIAEGAISASQGKTVLEEMFTNGVSPREFVAAKGLTVIADREVLQSMVEEVLQNHQELVKRYLEGEERLLGFFVGQVMQATKGQAEPRLVNKLLVKALTEGRNWQPREE